MTIRDLIRLLGDGGYHSGEALGEELGVSRTAVWKQLKKLEALDIPLEAIKGLGYRLANPIELLDGQQIIEALPRETRKHLTRLFVEESVDSTNTFIRERFRQGAGHAEVCLAEVQSAGRGRRGREWETPWGRSLVFSLGWRFESGAASLEGLSLAIGVAVAEVLEADGLPARLKWPNDVLLQIQKDQPKIAGILVEVTGDVSGPCDVVIGIGMNIELPASRREAITQPVAAIRDIIPGASRNRYAARLMESLLALLPEFESQGFAGWQARWNERNAFKGRDVVILRGDRREEAVAEGVDINGNLEVRMNGETITLAGGEISLRAVS
ncbi:MAG: biotin--[acetyl-CoA-carboxylase] ligase [Cobetia sp.]|jgi:BirA family biotin operon repressor/biotin-[acetyl-CoA-carboxylase] ligase|uniref:biotin--[acetyl-CoA-carboxylase] ligase n=1 Tax=Cobetia TaxID=204286 RepID=UPI000C5CD0B6|nr:MULTISPECIES: biotin--[acetyl-CoA-carboxylase] ligase [Cobetia]MBF08376.1 biotin--[acetyl-CoA-carboxylase] ligase [Cobetia sp.]UBU48596.1 biotin--[acetyl-CoA-carboxylase] ligase [Cobetia amphilecti]HAR09531.1 biotin--[acetyl-CoA-carboxylase] ligase [Cobetia sp.]HBJ29007.1 biotin--[acetyl-CoA-carboxylase] ligase [Cobetia sp.]|tara:strand:- start:1150 stop:2130 length:981 start_codon:yes stop_codon:yes gene_type:complete